MFYSASDGLGESQYSPEHLDQLGQVFVEVGLLPKGGSIQQVPIHYINHNQTLSLYALSLHLCPFYPSFPGRLRIVNRLQKGHF